MTSQPVPSSAIRNPTAVTANNNNTNTNHTTATNPTNPTNPTNGNNTINNAITTANTNNTNTNMPKINLYKETVWPEALPSANERFFISVTVEQSFLSFAQHEIEKEMNVRLIWRCPLLIMEEIDSADLQITDRIDFLISHLPSVTDKLHNGCNPHDYLFGPNNPATFESATKEAMKRKAHLTVYVVSEDANQTECVAKLFRCVPSRVWSLKQSDFLPKNTTNNTMQQHNYPTSNNSANTIGIKRLATLSGAMFLKGKPAMVFDVNDDTITYTASDSQGRLIGGGVSLGFAPRISALSNDLMQNECSRETSAMKALYAKMDGVTARRKPLSLFSNNRQDSIIANALSEVSTNARHVIGLWLNKVKHTTTHTNNSNTGGNNNAANEKKKKLKYQEPVNDDFTISIMGSHGTILHRLLQKNHGNVIESTSSSSQSSFTPESVSLFDRLVPFGIQATVYRHYSVNDSCVDQAVAKNFLVAGRGVVTKVGTVANTTEYTPGFPFVVTFEDGSKQFATLDEVLEMQKSFKSLKNFKGVGGGGGSGTSPDGGVRKSNNKSKKRPKQS